MKKLSIYAAVSVAVSVICGGAHAAPKVVYQPKVYTGGQSFEYSIKTNCLKTGSDPKALATTVASCFIAGMQKQAPAGTTITGGVTNFAGGPVNYSYLIKFSDTVKGKVLNNRQSAAQIIGSCPTGYSFTSDYKQCQRVETPAECVTRELAPFKKAYNDGIQWCTNTYNNDVGKMNIQMRTWRQQGGSTVGVLIGVTSAVFATVGAVTAPFGVVTGGSINGVLIASDVLLGKKLADHWAAYMNSTESAWNMKLLNQENKCFATFEKTYLGHKADAERACGK